MPASGEKVTQEEVLRSAEFDLLRQLQKTVRTVILAATVSNSCVNCSHSLSLQLFRLIRSCLLAGCRRFRGANPAIDDFLFLLIVPEYTGTFSNDLEFMAHLCVSHTVAGFARQLFEDERRVSHFYCDSAIMRDEELHLAFVSSLMALEPVNFHPDSPHLAQQCLRASLDNLQLQPVLWLQQGSGKLEDRVPAARPDKVLPKTDLGSLRSKGSASSVLAGFLAGISRRASAPKPVKEDEETAPQGETAAPAPAPAPAREASAVADDITPGEKAADQQPGDDSEAVPDSTGTAEKLEEVALALNETEELVRQLELEAKDSRHPAEAESEEKAETVEAQALLSEALKLCSNVLDLEDLATDCPLDEHEGGEGVFDGHVAEVAEGSEAQPSCDTKDEVESESLPPGNASDLGAALADAFGLNVSIPADPVPKVEVSLRDLVDAGSKARSVDAPARNLGRRSVPELSAPLQGASPASSSGNRLRSSTDPPGTFEDQSPSAGEADEADDAIAALEGLWRDSRKDTARRLMRASISVTAASKQLSRSLGREVRARGVSDAKSESGHSVAGSGSATHHLESPYSGDCSDSESENSSQRSVSTPSLLALQGELSVPFPSHGIHLEWKLKMHVRRPKDEQVSRQRGLCPGCRGRLPSMSLFQGPRYCHYLGYYFCTDCHHGDIRVIPARVAQRWDFEPKKVCRAVAKYLDLQVNQPLVPITSIKQTKVSSQKILTAVHSLRQQLTRMKDLVAEQGCEFQGQLSHLISQLDSHVARGHEHYAMQDLIRIHLEGWSCPLYTKVSRCVAVCSEHIKACPTCSGCSGTCPICGSGSPIYLFEVEKIHSCQRCRSVFHKACFRRANSECPFCLEASASQRRPSVAAVQAR